MVNSLPEPSGFDFEAAVRAPFRMQPGLRRLAPGARQLTPVRPGSRHQREKLAVLSAFPHEALQAVPGFDPCPALGCVLAQAMAEHPDAWRWDGQRAEALHLGTAVDLHGRVEQTRAGVFGLGDEVSRCLEGLPAEWRLAALCALGLAEDFAIVEGPMPAAPGEPPHPSRLAWTCVCLPSFWSPREKIGRGFADLHEPVPETDWRHTAGEALMHLATGAERWERFVWTVTPHTRLHGLPQHVDPRGWAVAGVHHAAWRTEHQGFIPVPGASGAGGRPQAVFCIRVEVEPLQRMLDRHPGRAALLHAALASQSGAVRRYRGWDGVADELLGHLQRQAGRDLVRTQGRNPDSALALPRGSEGSSRP